MDTSPAEERRRVPRHGGTTLGPIRLRTVPLGVVLDATVHDVSILGVGLLTDRPVGEETPLVVESGPAGKAPPTELTAQVCHATRLADNRWLLGCRFSRHLTLEDIEVLG